MSRKTFEDNKGLGTKLQRTVMARALSIAFGAAVLSMGATPVAMAQSNATGSLSGTVDATPGVTVVLTNKDNGARRTLTPDSAGRFSATSVATGNYRVEVVANGKVIKTSDNVEVRVGLGTDVPLATTLGTVTVVGGAKKIEMASMGSTTVFTATDLAKVPVANNVGAVIQLAPNTTRGDSRYGGGNAPSFGGSSASENAYYINGFPVTTLLTQVGFAQLPFNSIAQAQVLTGGYGAEFGRSTGGVVNIVTKSGGNQWVAGASYSIEPNSLRSKSKDILFENNGTPLDGKIRLYNEGFERTDSTLTGYIGGPLIQDKLFMYFAAEKTKTESSGVRLANSSATGTVSTASWQERTVDIPRYLLKLDWNITDAHRLEYTRISDKVQDSRTYYGFNYGTLQRNNVVGGGATYLNWGPAPTVAAQQGAEVDILKYTGYLTDDLTVTGVIGQTKTPHEFSPAGFNASLAQVTAQSGNTPPSLGVVPILQGTTGNILAPGAFDSNKGFRLDIEYKAGAKHTLRAGIEKNTIESLAGSSTAGGNQWVYLKTDPAVKPNVQTAPTGSVAGNPFAQQGYYVQKIVSATLSTPTVDQTAQYIEDRWQVTDRVLLSMGLRNEGFDNKNGDGKTYVNLPTQLAPRFGATWDLMGDQSLKVFGNLGRYHVPLPTNVAVRGAGSSLNAQTDYVYTGIDSNGAPTGLTAISPFYSNNNELGQAKDPREVAAADMKGNFQDELAFGFEQAVSKSLNIGAKFTYRTLRTAIDDHCDDRPFYAWADRNKIDASHWGYNCALFNPGEDNTFNLDLDGDGKLETIKLTAKELGFPPVDRKYLALDLFAEHPFDGKWYGKATYTFAKNEGNFEGQLLSDIGQGDVATTQAFDFPEFNVNSQGPLPNQRKHQIKLFGYYQMTPEWGVGGNMLYASGRPRNCIGNAPGATGSGDPYVEGGPVTNYSGYGSAYFFCNGVASPRGSQGFLDDDFKVDLNAVYKPDFAKGLQFKVDVFNLFNRQSVEAIEERRHARGSSTVQATYGTVQSYTAPRSVKLTMSYDYKF